MVKRLPYLLLAFALAISSTFLMGGKVRAASPIMYNGSVTWAVSRRGVTNNADFNYSVLEEQLPVLRSAGLITDQLGGFPWNYQNSTAYSSFPSWIAVKSKDLAQNGGYVYYAFAYAYTSHASISGLSLNANNLNAKLYRSGSIDSISNGTTLTMTKNTTTAPNSYISESYSQVSVNDPIFERITQGDGSSFATKAWYLSSSDTNFLDHGVANTLVYDYSESSLNWNRTNVVYGRVTVPATNTSGNEWSTVWIDCRNLVSGSFASQTTQSGYHFSDGDSGFATLRGGAILYMLPVYCYACSTDNYLEIEQYLSQILTTLQNNNQNNIPSSVLESYAALASEARDAAEQAVRDMSAAAPSFNESDYDIGNYIDDHALDQLTSVFGFLRRSKILPILLASLALLVMGYIFFGKK